MSASFWWLHVALTPAEVQQLTGPFQRALEATDAERIVRELESAWSSGCQDPASTAYALSDLLELRAFAQLGEQLVKKENPLITLSDANVLRFIVARRVSPISILYYSLGTASARTLPGCFGNLLLASGEIAKAETIVRRAMASGARDEHVRRGAEFYRVDHYPCEGDVEEMLDAWPQTLSAAKARGMGMISLAMRAP